MCRIWGWTALQDIGAHYLPDRQVTIPGIKGQGIRHGVFDRKGRHLYVMTEMACQVNVYEYEMESGRARLVQTISAMPKTCRPSSLGAAIRLHPKGKWLYASVRGSNHLAVFRIEEDGRLEQIQIQDSLGEIPRDFILSPDGEYLLAGNQDTDTICVFGISRENGKLSPLYVEKEACCVTVLAAWRNQ